jgi:hypothetical protein
MHAMLNVFGNTLPELTAYGSMAWKRTNKDDGTVFYIAFAEPNTAEAAAAWQACRIAVTAGGGFTSYRLTWADGDNEFDNVATDLTALSYS